MEGGLEPPPPGPEREAAADDGAAEAEAEVEGEADAGGSAGEEHPDADGAPEQTEDGMQEAVAAPKRPTMTREEGMAAALELFRERLLRKAYRPKKEAAPAAPVEAESPDAVATTSASPSPVSDEPPASAVSTATLGMASVSTAAVPKEVESCEEEFLAMIAEAVDEASVDRSEWADRCEAMSDKWPHICHWLHPGRLADFVASRLGVVYTGKRTCPAPKDERQQSKPVIRAKKYKCIECGIVCNSLGQYLIHEKGKKHLDYLEHTMKAAAKEGKVYISYSPFPCDGGVPGVEASGDAAAYYVQLQEEAANRTRALGAAPGGSRARIRALVAAIKPVAPPPGEEPPPPAASASPSPQADEGDAAAETQVAAEKGDDGPQPAKDPEAAPDGAGAAEKKEKKKKKKKKDKEKEKEPEEDAAAAAALAGSLNQSPSLTDSTCPPTLTEFTDYGSFVSGEGAAAAAAAAAAAPPPAAGEAAPGGEEAAATSKKSRRKARRERAAAREEEARAAAAAGASTLPDALLQRQASNHSLASTPSASSKSTASAGCPAARPPQVGAFASPRRTSRLRMGSKEDLEEYLQDCSSTTLSRQEEADMVAPLERILTDVDGSIEKKSDGEGRIAAELASQASQDPQKAALAWLAASRNSSLTAEQLAHGAKLASGESMSKEMQAELGRMVIDSLNKGPSLVNEWMENPMNETLLMCDEAEEWLDEQNARAWVKYAQTFAMSVQLVCQSALPTQTLTTAVSGFFTHLSNRDGEGRLPQAAQSHILAAITSLSPFAAAQKEEAVPGEKQQLSDTLSYFSQMSKGLHRSVTTALSTASSACRVPTGFFNRKSDGDSASSPLGSPKAASQ
eukprot:TRINITY_DN7435_c0_g1_i1.p1 TRINITY_DN7435_c0_g1~~TRINITY_DN7435_c0_g1_i1.p1  ORF type:complete len:871 (+),score=357.69 TRINITY_DN7435_c0_g1_i1:56-2614(+)